MHCTAYATYPFVTVNERSFIKLASCHEMHALHSHLKGEDILSTNHALILPCHHYGLLAAHKLVLKEGTFKHDIVEKMVHLTSFPWFPSEDKLPSLKS